MKNLSESLLISSFLLAFNKRCTKCFPRLKKRTMKNIKNEKVKCSRWKTDPGFSKQVFDPSLLSINKRLEVLSAAWVARDRVVDLMVYDIVQSVEALYTVVSHVGTYLVDSFWSSLEAAYYSGELACSYTLTIIFCVGDTSNEMQSSCPSFRAAEILMTTMLQHHLR